MTKGWQKSEPLERGGTRWLGMALEAVCRGREPYPVGMVERQRLLENGRKLNQDPAGVVGYQCFVRYHYDESDAAGTGVVKIQLWCNTGIGITRDVPVGLCNQHQIAELLQLIYDSNKATDILLGDNQLLRALKEAHQQR